MPPHGINAERAECGLCAKQSDTVSDAIAKPLFLKALQYQSLDSDDGAPDLTFFLGGILEASASNEASPCECAGNS